MLHESFLEHEDSRIDTGSGVLRNTGRMHSRPTRTFRPPSRCHATEFGFLAGRSIVLWDAVFDVVGTRLPTGSSARMHEIKLRTKEDLQ